MRVTTRRRLVGVVIAGAFTACLAAPAAALGTGDPAPPPTEPAKVKCNSGGGNGSEANPITDCDPGNSGGRNNGGD